jgi:2-polyprenyl-3-methyl-5-hydroxy-6-metoxy-1,4-benzoquinol methylase
MSSMVANAASWQQEQAPAEFAEKNVAPIAVQEIPECPVCQSASFAPYSIGFDYESLTCSNPWRFVRCAECAHVWLNPRPALSTLSTIYPPSYYAYNYKAQINPIALRAKALLDRRKFASLLRHLPRRPRSFLDAGCGDGRFLRLMESEGVARATNYGLELDEAVVRPLADAGFQVFCERVEECSRIPEASIDLITMFHVIEHVDDPAAVVRKLVSWLAPGGLLALETPNIQSLDARLFGKRHWGGYHFPRHWNLFSPATLARLLRSNGLEVMTTQYQTGHSFWMYSFHHMLRYGRRPRRALARQFNPFRGLPMLVLFTAFDKLRAALGYKTSAMLMVARKPLEPNWVVPQ